MEKALRHMKPAGARVCVRTLSDSFLLSDFRIRIVCTHEGAWKVRCSPLWIVGQDTCLPTYLSKLSLLGFLSATKEPPGNVSEVEAHLYVGFGAQKQKTRKQEPQTTNKQHQQEKQPAGHY